ncbi:MAG: hypothetical protein ACK47C_05980 [Paracoccaceae bacterium]
MAHRFTIIPEKRTAFFKFWDEVSVASAKNAFVSYTLHKDFDPTNVMVTDAREVTSIHASFQSVFFEVQGLRELLGRFAPGAVSVILVRDSTQFGYARMLQQVLDYMSPIKLLVAYSEDELRTLAERPDLNIAQLSMT